jgi:hypothetical protein
MGILGSKTKTTKKKKGILGNQTQPLPTPKVQSKPLSIKQGIKDYDNMLANAKTKPLQEVKPITINPMPTIVERSIYEREKIDYPYGKFDNPTIGQKKPSIGKHPEPSINKVWQGVDKLANKVGIITPKKQPKLVLVKSQDTLDGPVTYKPMYATGASKDRYELKNQFGGLYSSRELKDNIIEIDTPELKAMADSYLKQELERGLAEQQRLQQDFQSQSGFSQFAQKTGSVFRKTATGSDFLSSKPNLTAPSELQASNPVVDFGANVTGTIGAYAIPGAPGQSSLLGASNKIGQGVMKGVVPEVIQQQAKNKLIEGGLKQTFKNVASKQGLKTIGSRTLTGGVEGAASMPALTAFETAYQNKSGEEMYKKGASDLAAGFAFGGVAANVVPLIFKGLPTGIKAIYNKLKAGNKITQAETDAMTAAAQIKPELLQLPEVKRLMLPEKTTSKIELGPAKQKIEPPKPKADFYATERSVAKNIDDFKKPPASQQKPLMLNEGKPQAVIPKSVKTIEKPFEIIKGETKYGNKKSGVKLPENTQRLSGVIKEQAKSKAKIKSGEYSNIGKKYDFIKPNEPVKVNKSIYADAKGMKERPFVEVKGKLPTKEVPIKADVAEPIKGKGLLDRLKNNQKGSGLLTFGNELRKSSKGSNYISETATEIKSTKEANKAGQNLWSKFYTNFVDNQKAIKDFSKDAKQTGLRTDVLANNSRNASGTVEYILREKLVDKAGKEIGDSYKSIIDSVPKNQELAFNDYMLHRHNVYRMAEEKPIFRKPTTAEQSLQEVKNYDTAYPEFKKSAESYDKFINTFMETWGVDSGLISKDTWKALKVKFPNYVPTYRVFLEVERTGKGFGGAGQKFTNTSNPLKTATGSIRDKINPLEKTMDLIDKTVKAAKDNEVGQSIVEALRTNKNLGKWAEIVQTPKQGLVDDINAILKEDGLEGLIDKFGQQFDEVFNKKPTGNNIVRVMENGNPVYIKINNLEFFKAITGLTKSQPGAIEGFVRKYLTTPFKSLITTKNPIFATKNISRDIPTAYVNGSEKNPAKFLADLSEAAKDMSTNAPMYQEFKAIGGKYSSYFKSDLNNLYKGTGKLEKVNTSIESLPRYAEYRKTVLKGGNSYISKMQGLYNAAEVTTNFAKHGNIGRTIDAFVPYFNPSVQGIDKFIRQFKTNPYSTVGKSLAVVTLPTVGLWLINKDNPNYQKLDNRTKDNYFVIPNFTDRDENGYAKTFIKIPKAREYGAIFGSLFERILRTANKEPDSFNGYGRTVATNFLPASSTIVDPFIDLKTNKDFAGRTIVPANMQNLSPRYQYDERTTEPAKFFGDKLNLSPKQIDFIIKSYTGILGQIGQPMTTKQTYSSNDSLNTKVTGALGNIVARNFKADPAYNNDIVNDFYSNKKKLDIAKNDYKKKDVKSNTYDLSLQKQFSTGAEKISKKYDKIDEIQKDSSLSSAEKEKQSRAIREEILEIAKSYNDKFKGK